ncbi:MAG: hypothetical protein HW414_1831 [Dehalococcoidia bacterium]|nr:hypothetical protein [Dehalococcoidia bacterium]
MKSGTIIAVILALLLLTTASLACEVNVDLAIENQTEEVLTIYWLDNKLGSVEPGRQIVKRGIPSNIGRQLIVAKNAQGETVFSKKLLFLEMERTDNGYKVVIRSSEGP